MTRHTFVLGLAAAFLATGAALPRAASDAPTYRTPPKAIVDMLDAPPFPGVSVSPTRERAILFERRAMPPIRELAQPMFRLAGERMNPRNYAPHRSTNIVALTLVTVADGTQSRVTLPPNTTARPIGFSADGTRYAYAVVADDSVTLWALDIATARARELTPEALNATLAASEPPCEWNGTGTALLCRFARQSPPRVPQAPDVPTGPSVQENVGKATPAPTYQDLLKNDYDEAVFEYLTTSQLAWVDAKTGAKTPVGAPGIYESAQIAPNGEYVLVSRLKRPFSRTVPYDDFAKNLQVWDRTGRVVKEIADLPVADNVPIGGVSSGPRGLRWNRSAPATIVWVEALDGGDTRREAKERDRVLTLNAPFAGTAHEIARTAARFQSISWTEKGVAFLSEFDRKSRTTRTWAVDDEGAPPRKVWDRNVDDAYNAPGTPLQRPGRGVAVQHGDSIYLAGEGSSPTGDHPFLATLNVRTGATARTFETVDGTYEQVVALLADDGSRVLTRYETPTDPPNYYVRTLATKERRALTHYPDPAPQLAGVEKRRLSYVRKDGVPLTATLYLPPGHKAGDKHPVLLWAYPREFGDSSTAGQVRGSLSRFTTVSGPSHLPLLTEGYAILDDPTMPIVGEGDTANDTYIDQLVSSAEAAVDAVVKLGVADRDRFGVGGHSYGAFMTANLLAHSDLFRAGLARSGAYNRTLTPFGFQNEQRTFWEVPDIYARMSPFWFAHKINEPILLIHGEADDNTGTYPIQSERFYAALKGHGATVRYVTLPNEAHGYAARESILHTVAEMLDWMDKYVKNAAPKTTSTSSRQ
ncbi:MAG: prolyl oligopeptidase family serine peptidase [Vicinamibacterales bacterium]